MGNLPIIEGSQAKLLEWKSKDNELDIVTARQQLLSNATHKFIRREFPMVDNIKVVGWDNNKEDFLRDYDVIIDDNPLCIKSAIKLDIPYIFMVSNSFTKYNYPYYEQFKDKIKIVDSIVDVII